ncbi:hypothetical protein VRB95_06360 [Erwinia aphidicola]|uniref:hypothetical protein n=1 Tax=Erwinia aphidicola TaxID=68334 RepID=UPI0030CD00A2
MNINARIVKAVVTLPILGTVSRDAGGNIKKHGEHYRVNIFAANPGWKKETLKDFLVVGVLTGGGYTTESFKRSQQVILPEGRELVALRMNDDGTPASWDSLPVSIDDGDTAFTAPDGKVYSMEVVVNTDTKEKEDARLAELVRSVISDRIRKELLPGGLLYSR